MESRQWSTPPVLSTHPPTPCRCRASRNNSSIRRQRPGFHNDEIEVGLRCRVTLRLRTEQDDLRRIHLLDDGVHHAFELCAARHGVAPFRQSTAADTAAAGEQRCERIAHPNEPGRRRGAIEDHVDPVAHPQMAGLLPFVGFLLDRPIVGTALDLNASRVAFTIAEKQVELRPVGQAHQPGMLRLGDIARCAAYRDIVTATSCVEREWSLSYVTPVNWF